MLSGGAPGAHTVEGVAPGFVPAQFDRTLMDGALGIDEAQGRAMARRLAREENILAGSSTGLNVAGALQIAHAGGLENRSVTVAADSGGKYLARSLYSSVNHG